MKLLVTTQAVDVNDPILGFMVGWLRELSTHFERIDVVCLRKGSYSLPSHVYVHSLGKEDGESRSKYVLRFYAYFIKILFGVRVDYVFYHMGAIYNILGFPFFLIRSLLHTKFYWWKAHGHINALGRVALCFVDRVYTSTESGFPIATKKRHIVGQAIDAAKFTVSEDVVRDENLILFVGRVTRIKHLEELIATARILIRTHPQLRFKIIGPHDDPEYLKVLKTESEKAGLDHVLEFLGPRSQDEIVGFYRRAGFFLNTSMTQSMDKTVLEAALCGCIPVTSNVAFRELLSDEGLFHPTGSPEGYATIIGNMIGKDTTELKNRLRDTVVRTHSLDTFSERIFGI